MDFNRRNLTDHQLLSIYEALLKPRLIEEKMFLLLRQGKISKWFSAYGQEAVSIGATLALDKDEYLLPMHRNLGMFTARDVDLVQLFAQFQGKKEGFTKGRDRSFHFGSKAHHLVGMISHLGAQMGVADGIALASKLRNEQKVTLVVSGDGGASEGDFHEALNLASVWNLPVIFLVENNQWGLSTPSCEQFNCESFVDKGIGYGMSASQVDGNNVLAVYHEIERIATGMRANPKPHLLECMTFRIRGHEEASGTKYYPEGLIEKWSKYDPVENYQQYLLTAGILHEKASAQIRSRLNKEIEEAFNKADRYAPIEPDEELEIGDVFDPNVPKAVTSMTALSSNKRFVDAISEGLRQAMERFPDLVLMGQDIAEYGGVFKVTEGFVDSFGKKRVINTPICESAVLGAALGMSIAGMKSVVEMQFADFISTGFNQVVNNLAKAHYRWGQNADVVIRMPTGAGVGAGPYHSQSNEAWFFHTPGLKILYPSNPYDAKGLLTAAIADPNPCMFFEHKALYRSVSADVPDDYYTLEIGKASIVREGEDLTIITYGAAVAWVLDVLNENREIRAEVLDMRTLIPWDQESITDSVKKTGKVLVCHEDVLTGGIGAEIASWIGEHLFEYLDAPIMRAGSMDTPVPFSITLEQNFLPKQRIRDKIKVLQEY